MKKIILLIFFFFVLPISANADVRVVAHLIDAQIEVAGGMRVRELIIVEGTTNVFSRTINYRHLAEVWDGETINFNNGTIYNGFSLENVRVSAFEVEDTINFSAFSYHIDFFNEGEGNPKTFNYTSNELGATYNIYQTIQNERIGFYLEYWVSNVVVIHNDIAEINYSFKNLNIGAEYTLIRVLIPFATDNEKYAFWVHGSSGSILTELRNYEDNAIGFTVQSDNISSTLRFRMALPREQIMVALNLNHSKVDGLEEIKRVEDRLAEYSTRYHDLFKQMLIIISSIYLITSLILLKFKENSIFIIYLILGLVIITFNYLFAFHILTIYLMILIPIMIKCIQFLLRKKISNKS